MSHRTAHDIVAGPEFRQLRASRLRATLLLTAAQLIVLFSFVSLAAFRSPLITGERATAGWGVTLAVATIIISWALAGAYMLWANGRYDARVRYLRGRIGS